MHFENVSILINSIADIIKDMNYCWKDRQGHICSQSGVFRVNCIDCLDRTNVVQVCFIKQSCLANITVTTMRVIVCIKMCKVNIFLSALYI